MGSLELPQSVPHRFDRRHRNLRRCKVRRSERSLIHEQGCASSVSGQRLSCAAGEKTSSTLTRSFFELDNLGGSADPSIGKMLSERKLLPLPILSVAETPGWCQSEGNVDLPTSYAKFTIEGVNHLYGSPAKRLRKNSSLGQREAQHKNCGSRENTCQTEKKNMSPSIKSQR